MQMLVLLLEPVYTVRRSASMLQETSGEWSRLMISISEHVGLCYYYIIKYYIIIIIMSFSLSESPST